MSEPQTETASRFFPDNARLYASDRVNIDANVTKQRLKIDKATMSELRPDANTDLIEKFNVLVDQFYDYALAFYNHIENINQAAEQTPKLSFLKGKNRKAYFYSRARNMKYLGEHTFSTASLTHDFQTAENGIKLLRYIIIHGIIDPEICDTPEPVIIPERRQAGLIKENAAFVKRNFTNFKTSVKQNIADKVSQQKVPDVKKGNAP